MIEYGQTCVIAYGLTYMEIILVYSNVLVDNIYSIK